MVCLIPLINDLPFIIEACVTEFFVIFGKIWHSKGRIIMSVAQRFKTDQ